MRGLEAIEQPSQVTLFTTSRYVARGLRYGLSEWREVNYSWEHFGVQKPIRNADLWQRIDGAMQYHEVACRLLESSLARVDAAAVEAIDPELPSPYCQRPIFVLDLLWCRLRKFHRRGTGRASSASRSQREAQTQTRSVPEPFSWRNLASGIVGWARGRSPTNPAGGVHPSLQDFNNAYARLKTQDPGYARENVANSGCAPFFCLFVKHACVADSP